MASSSQATTASADASDNDVTDLNSKATSQPESEHALLKRTALQHEKHNKLAATVRWVEDGQTREQPGLMFDLQYHAAFNTAFLKLRASVAIKRDSAPEQVSLFVFLAPEAVQTLSLRSDHAQELGPDTICLRFVLRGSEATAPVLVVPKTVDLFQVGWKNKQSQETWNSLRLLTRARNFDVLCRLPRRVMSEARLQSFCQALSGDQVVSTPGFADLGGLYGGKGGRVAQFESKVEVEDTALDESLPAYEDLEPGPPLPPMSQDKPSNKRRRLSSDSGSQMTPIKPKDDLETTVAWLVDELKEHKAREALLLNELKEVHAKVDMLICQQEQHRAKCTILENEVHDRVSAVETRLDEVDDELESRVDCRIDETLDEKSDSIKGELADYIDESLPNKIQGALEEVTFSARF